MSQDRALGSSQAPEMPSMTEVELEDLDMPPESQYDPQGIFTDPVGTDPYTIPRSFSPGPRIRVRSKLAFPFLSEPVTGSSSSATRGASMGWAVGLPADDRSFV